LSPQPHSITTENNSLVRKKSLMWKSPEKCPLKKIGPTVQQEIRIGYSITQSVVAKNRKSIKTDLP